MEGPGGPARRCLLLPHCALDDSSPSDNLLPSVRELNYTNTDELQISKS